MIHPRLVGRADPGSDLPRDRHDLARLQFAVLAQVLRQAVALEILHDDERPGFVVVETAPGTDADDGRVLQRLDDVGLGEDLADRAPGLPCAAS